MVRDADGATLRRLLVWHEFLDQRKELSLLKPDVCVKQFPRRIQRLSIDDAQWGGGRTFFSGEGLFLVKLSGPGTVLVSSYGAMGGVE